MLVIFIFPTFILVSTVITYFLLNKALRAYISKIEGKTKTIQRISLLLIASDFVSLFSSSESKNLVEKLVRPDNDNEESLFESLNTSFGEAGSEIEKLYREINRAYRPSEDLSRIKLSATYLESILLIYGVLLSISQYGITYLYYPGRFDLFSPLSIDLLVATMLFSSIAVYVVIYIFRISRRIEMRYSKLQETPLPVS